MQDRRLDQDDNRGLGQGVQDNEPILNIFKLRVENVYPCVKRSNNYAGGYLTKSTYDEMTRLLHPMEKLVWHENDWVGVLPTFGKGNQPLEIGTEIAVLKNLKHVPVSSSNKKSTIGLVIHREHLEKCDHNDKPSEVVSLMKIILEIFDSLMFLFDTSLTSIECWAWMRRPKSLNQLSLCCRKNNNSHPHPSTYVQWRSKLLSLTGVEAYSHFKNK